MKLKRNITRSACLLGMILVTSMVVPTESQALPSFGLGKSKKKTGKKGCKISEKRTKKLQARLNTYPMGKPLTADPKDDIRAVKNEITLVKSDCRGGAYKKVEAHLKWLTSERKNYLAGKKASAGKVKQLKRDYYGPLNDGKLLAPLTAMRAKDVPDKTKLSTLESWKAALSSDAFKTWNTRCGEWKTQKQTLNADDKYDPNALCKAAAQWRPTLQRMATQALAAADKKRADSIERDIKRLAEKSEILPSHLKRFLKRQTEQDTSKAAWGKVLDAVPADFMPKATAQFARLDEALKAAGKKGRMADVAKFKATKMWASFKTEKKFADMKMIKVASEEKRWREVTNAFGKKLHRNRMYRVMLKTKGESFCRTYRLNVKQLYEGHWGTVQWLPVTNHDIRISACR